MALSVKMATRNDIEKLIQVRFDYFETQEWEITPEQHASFKSNLQQYFMKHLNVDFFAAMVEENDHILSIAFLAITEKPANPFFPTGRTGIILNVLTAPEYRRRGLATRTMHALIEEAKRLNLSYLELSASKDGKPLYQKLGFSEKKSSRSTEMRMSLL